MSDFAAYLEAKRAVDSAALNRRVYRLFLRGLAGLPVARVLEVGAGTGAMVRRLATERRPAELRITAVDRKPALLEVAAGLLADEAAGLGRQVERSPGAVCVSRDGGRLEACFVAADLLDDLPGRLGGARYDAVTAHAVLDVVPLDAALRVVAALTAPAGLFYSPTGGSRTGSRLLAALARAGFRTLAYGPSDWEVAPSGGRYRAGDAVFLEAMLSMIREEGVRQGLGAQETERWHRERMVTVQACGLTLVTHQADVLARAPVEP